MSINIRKRDVTWSYLGYFLNFSTNLLILPMVLRCLNAEQLGLWYTFISLGSLVMLMDFGFSPVITRNITFAWSGAKNIRADGVGEYGGDGKPNYRLLRHIFEAANQVYAIISLLALGLIVTAGSVYIWYVTRTMPGFAHWIAWGIYGIAIVLNLFLGRWFSFLSALGLISCSQKINILSKLIYIGLGALGLAAGLGLTGIASAFLISSFVPRILAKRLIARKVTDDGQVATPPDPAEVRQLYPLIWYNAKRYGVVALAGFFTAQSGTLICSACLGLQEAGAYGLSLQLIGIVGSVASVLFHTFFPSFSAAVARNDYDKLLRSFALTISTSWLILLIGSCGVLLFGEKVVHLISSGKTLLSPTLLLLLTLNLALEKNLSLFLGFITTMNLVPFVRSNLIASIVTVMLSLLTVLQFQWGALGLILSPLLVQSVYNYWRWPLFVFRKLETGPITVLKLAGKLFQKKIYRA